MRIPLINRFTCSPKQLPIFIERIKGKKMIPIIDNISENGNQKDKNFQNILRDIENYPMSTFAIKLSALNIRDEKESLSLIEDKVQKVCQQIEDTGSTLIIDAEEYEINHKIDQISDAMMSEFNQQQAIVYKTYQMYRRDTTKMFLEDILKERNYRVGCKIVRGAYYNQDVTSGKLFWRIEDTHRAYNDAIRYFLNHKSLGDKLLCATHNFESNDIVKQHIHHGEKDLSIGHLLGMSDYLSEELVDEGISVYKYLPYGEYRDTLPYLSRRLYENYPILGHMI